MNFTNKNKTVHESLSPSGIAGPGVMGAASHRWVVLPVQPSQVTSALLSRNLSRPPERIAGFA